MPTARQPESEAEYAAFDQIGEDATDRLASRAAAESVSLKVMEQACGHLVATESDVVVASEFLAQLQDMHAQLESARVALVKPLNDHVRNINQVFKDRRVPVENAIATLKSRVSEYHHQKEREAAEIEAKLQTEQRAAQEAAELLGSAPAPEVAIERPRTAGHATSGSAQVRKRWTYEEESLFELVRAAADDPMRYLGLLQLDAGAMRRAINGGLHEVPGMRIFQETDVAVRRNPR